MRPSRTSEVYRKFNQRTTTFKPSTQSWTKYYQQIISSHSPDNMLESLHKMQVAEQGAFICFLDRNSSTFFQRILRAKEFSKLKITNRSCRSREDRASGIKIFAYTGTLVTEVPVPSRQPGNLKSWVCVSRGIEQCARQFVPTDTAHQNCGAVFSPQSSSCARLRAHQALHEGSTTWRFS